MSRRLFNQTRTSSSKNTPKTNSTALNQIMKKQMKVDQISRRGGSYKPQTSQISLANRKIEESRLQKWRSSILSDFIIPSGMVHKILGAINSEKKGDFDFYFLDGKEIYENRQFSLMLFGKIRTRNGELEAKVRVKDPKRQMYVFPRRDEKMEDVKQEIIKALGRETAGKVGFRVVKKKYCFEINLEYR